MRDGFLGYPASFMLDVVVCALLVVVPLLLASLAAVKWRRRYRLHKSLQLLLAGLLLVAVTLFEIDMQWQGGIAGILSKRPQPLPAGDQLFFDRLLKVHLVFAISTVILWLITVVLALRNFADPPAPGAHSRWHRRLGWLSAVDITLTAVTGLMVYYFGFMV
jgi:uncharacterized membrane protein YozB (DUF420 family)